MHQYLLSNYLRNFKTSVSESNRFFGVEVELSLISLENFHAINNIKITECFLIQVADSLNMQIIYDEISKKLIRLESFEHSNYKLIISPDFSTSTIEISTKPETDLSTLIANLGSISNKLNEVAHKNKLYLIGCGMHPFTKPDILGVYHFNSRYAKITIRDLPYLLCQSLHFTFEISLDKVMEVYETVNKLVPFFTLLFGSSPLFQGKHKGVNSFREKLWIIKSKEDPRYGFGPFATSIEDYFAQMLSLPISRVIRDNRYVFIKEKKSFQQFFHELTAQRQPDVKSKDADQMMMNDYYVFESTIWHNIRIRNKISAIEIRAIDSVPLKYIPSVITFIRGLIANIEEVTLILSPIHPRELRDLHEYTIRTSLRKINTSELDILAKLIKASELGLKLIKQEKCVPYLIPIKKIYNSQMNIADLIMEQYEISMAGSSRMDRIFQFLTQDD